jgi:hypothetical protein
MPFRYLRAQVAIAFARFQYLMSGQAPNPSILTLFPEITQEDSVRTWCGNAVVAENVGYARRGQIRTVVHSKSNNGKNHEDIMFEVQIDGQTSWILTDRSAGGRNRPSSHLPSPSHSRKDLSASSSSNAAYDRIVVPTFGKYDGIVLWIKDDPVVACSLEIPSDISFSLADLAGLLPLVSAQAKNYNPFAKQCYWYARAVYESIRQKYPMAVENRGDAYLERGKHAKLLPVPCGVSEDELKLIQSAWLMRVEEVSQVETISLVKSCVLNCLWYHANSVQQMQENTRVEAERRRSAEDRARTAEGRLQHEMRATQEAMCAAQKSKTDAEQAKRNEADARKAVEEERRNTEEAKRNEADARKAVEEERRNAEEAKRNEADARKAVEEERRNAEEAKRNEENARRNEIKEKRKRLELEAELREMRETLKVRGNT